MEIIIPPNARNRCFALVDCNNFFVSCERVFNPKLKNKPVVVLSSNDGCIVARSNEAKALNIGMGQPYFKSLDIVKKHNVKAFSSNFALYGDMSHRVMASLEQFSPETEIYSIDEAFLNLDGCDHVNSHENLTEYARTICARVTQWTGIPVSVGIARTKGLAKIANHIAKKFPKTKGVLNLLDSPFTDLALERVPIVNVWGVGRQTMKWLITKGVTNARQLRDMDDKVIANKMGVVGLRLIYELRGISCLSLEKCPPAKKGIISSRSFGTKTSSLAEVKGAVANHITIAAKKLRMQHSVVNILSVFLLTHNPDKGYKSGGWGSAGGRGLRGGSTIIRLPKATNNTAELIFYAMKGTEKIFREDCTYKKAGVMFDDLIPEDQVQSTLFDSDQQKGSKQLTETIDNLNAILGSGTLRYASQIPSDALRTKSEKCSPHYTTSWDDLVTVR